MRTVLLIICFLSALCHAQNITLTRDGKSDYVIVVPTNALPAVLRGATEIQRIVKQISGAQLSIQQVTQPLPAHAIVVGMSLKRIALPDEAFMIETVNNHVYVNGGGARGAMFGCTALLERLGVRFLTPTVARVPTQATIEFEPINVRESPAFEYREVFFTEAFDKDWAARLRLNGHHHQLDDSTGGKITYGRFVHTFDELIPQAEFDKHPEYFPLINGQRTGGYVQRCLTHPDVLRLSIEKVRQWIKEQPAATIFSVSQNDAGKWCECEKCAELTKQHGAHSGLYLWFVNQVAEAIAVDYPDKLIDTLAYQFTEAPPTGVKPRSNVRIRLCPIACCEAHPYEQCTAEANQKFVANLSAWSKITDSLYIWHYNTNFANYLMPFPDFAQFPSSARMYRDAGVKGIFFQGGYAPGGCASDAELRAYVMAKLLWNPNQDADAVVNEWINGIYGNAAKPMQAWHDLKQQQVRDPDRHIFIYDSPDKPYLSEDVLAKGLAMHDEAERLAAGDTVALEYINKSRLWIHYTRLMRNPTLGKDFDEFMADARKRGITQFREGESLDAFEKRYASLATGKK